MDCPLCGKPMFPNPLGLAGEPCEVCPVDDAAHRAHAAAVKAECEALLRDAAKPKPGPTPEALAEIGARFRPDPALVGKDTP